jgi:hypothetical protein
MLKAILFIIVFFVGYSLYSWLRHREGRGGVTETLEDLPESGQYHPANYCDSGETGMLS